MKKIKIIITTLAAIMLLFLVIIFQYYSSIGAQMKQCSSSLIENCQGLFAEGENFFEK